MSTTARTRIGGPERRERILAAATTAFAEAGYDDAAMDAIALGAGITKPVLYDHFPSKRALYRAVLESIRARLLGDSTAISTSVPGRGAAFARVVDVFFAMVERRPAEARVLLTAPRDPDAQTAWRAVTDGATAGIAAMVETLPSVEPGWQAEAIAAALRDTLHALGRWWMDHPDRSRAELVRTATQLTWLGLGGQRTR